MGSQGSETKPDSVRAGEASEEERERLRVGRIAGVHGLKGELKVDLTDAAIPSDLDAGLTVWLEMNESFSAHEIVRAREVTAGARKGIPRVLLALQDINDRSAAEAWPGAHVWMERGDVMNEGEFLLTDLIGYAAFDLDRKPLGTIVDVDLAGQGLLVLERENGERRDIPAVEPILADILADEAAVLLDLPEGLL